MFYGYILYSHSSDLFYVGSSQNPWKRLEKHNTSKFSTFTSKHRPWELVAVFEAGESREEAETLVKKQKSRKLIIKNIAPNFNATGKLAHPDIIAIGRSESHTARPVHTGWRINQGVFRTSGSEELKK